MAAGYKDLQKMEKGRVKSPGRRRVMEEEEAAAGYTATVASSRVGSSSPSFLSPSSQQLHPPLDLRTIAKDCTKHPVAAGYRDLVK